MLLIILPQLHLTLPSNYSIPATTRRHDNDPLARLHVGSVLASQIDMPFNDFILVFVSFSFLDPPHLDCSSHTARPPHHATHTDDTPSFHSECSIAQGS
jgi:hypothetical protein